MSRSHNKMTKSWINFFFFKCDGFHENNCQITNTSRYNLNNHAKTVSLYTDIKHYLYQFFYQSEREEMMNDVVSDWEQWVTHTDSSHSHNDSLVLRHLQCHGVSSELWCKPFLFPDSKVSENLDFYGVLPFFI